MTFDEYVVSIRAYMNTYPLTRAGQATYNSCPDHMVEKFRTLPENLRLYLDPFNNNEAIPRFLAWMADHWESEG